MALREPFRITQQVSFNLIIYPGDFMSIQDLADSANLYDNWQQLKAAQIQIETSINYYQKQLSDIITAIQNNPQFPSVNPVEQKYITDLPAATLSAADTIKTVKAPEAAVTDPALVDPKEPAI